MLIPTRYSWIVGGDVIISIKGANMNIGGCRAIRVMLERGRAWIPKCVDPRGRGSLGDRWNFIVLHRWDLKITKEVVKSERVVKFVGFR